MKGRKQVLSKVSVYQNDMFNRWKSEMNDVISCTFDLAHGDWWSRTLAWSNSWRKA